MKNEETERKKTEEAERKKTEETESKNKRRKEDWRDRAKEEGAPLHLQKERKKKGEEEANKSEIHWPENCELRCSTATY